MYIKNKLQNVENCVKITCAVLVSDLVMLFGNLLCSFDLTFAVVEDRQKRELEKI